MTIKTRATILTVLRWFLANVNTTEQNRIDVEKAIEELSKKD